MIIKILLVTTSLTLPPTQCSIGGVSYLDPLSFQPLDKYPRGENPCHPLYWYPRQIPDWCNQVTEPPMIFPPVPPPTPCPGQPPPPPPFVPPPFPPPMFPPPMFPPPMFPPPMFPPPLLPPPPPMLPHPVPFPAPPPPFPPVYPPGMVGMVPGLPGLVSEDGGLNIMPFSDAYADLLEGHKQKMIRLRLQKLLDEYNRYQRRKYRRRHTH